MSGTQVSSAPNVLFDPMMALRQQEGQNQLLQQQQDISGHEMEMASRLANTVLDPTLYPTPEARAAAYPTLLANARQTAPGYFKNAPETYPGDDVAHALARMGTPSQTQAEWAANIAANKAISAAGNTTAQPAAGGGTAPAVTPSGGATIGQRQNNPGNLTFAGQPYAQPGQGNRFAAFPDMPTGVAANADQLSLYQTQHGINTVRGAVTRWVGDPKADLTSYIGDISKALGVGPDDKIDLTDPAVQAKFIQAQFPHESAGGGYVLNPADVAKGVQMAAARRGQTVQPTPPAAVAAVPGAPAAPGTPATPAPYRTASNAPVPPPTPTAPGQAAPAPGQPAVPGGAASAPQPPAPPAGGPAPPQLQPLNANGLTTRQQAILDAQGATGKMTGQQRIAAEQAYANQNIQLQQKQFSDWIQTQQLATSQGQLSVAQQNSALEYWKAAHPNAKITLTGGEIITQNERTGEEIAPRIQVTPQRADTAAMAIVSRLGPKVANGNATPEEQAQYAVAVDSYRQPVLRENPVTKETLRVNTRELPAGFPEPPALGSGSPGAAGAGGGQVVIPGYSPAQQEVERDPARAKVADERYARDSRDVGDLSKGVMTAQNDNLRTKEMLDILEHGDFSTGPGSETRTRAAAWFQRWAPAALTGWEKQSTDLKGAAAAQAFQKLAFQGVTTQEKESSPRGGILATQLFQKNNPGLDLLNPTNKSLLDMKLIQNQANIDYGRGALDHFTTQETRYGDTHKYDSLEQFNTQWINQRNPQVYAAAMGAVSGQPPEQWTKGLSDAEYARALGIVERAKPGAVVNGKSGRIVVQPPAAPPPPAGFKVVQ
jgi:hypothetical protein